MTPDIDFNDFAIEHIPPDKRQFPFWKAFFVGLIGSQLFRLHDIFKKFIYGNTAFVWNDLTVYSNDNEVKYEYKIYKSISTHSNKRPDLYIGTHWILISNSFIGMKERSRFRGNKINLEYALNRVFSTTFRQPDHPITPTNSDIYISSLPVVYNSFVSFADNQSSASYLNTSSGFSFSDEVYGTATSYLFIINIPSAVFAFINPNPVIAEKVVRDFADKYVVTGTDYTLNIY